MRLLTSTERLKLFRVEVLHLRGLIDQVNG